MGMTYVQMKMARSGDGKKARTLKFLVDSGALYTVAPEKTLKELGVKPHSTRIFTLANGEVIERKVGDALFAYRGQKGSSPVIFGEAGDSNLLGTVTLETLGFILDPLARELKTLPMTLVGMR